MLGLVYKYFFLSVISITKPLQKTGFLGYVQKNYIFFFNRHFLILLQNCSVLYVHSVHVRRTSSDSGNSKCYLIEI